MKLDYSTASAVDLITHAKGLTESAAWHICNARALSAQGLGATKSLDHARSAIDDAAETLAYAASALA